MNYKLEGAIKKSKKSFIICAILWLVLVIVFVAPFSYSAFQATNDAGKVSMSIYGSTYGKYNKSICSISRHI